MTSAAAALQRQWASEDKARAKPKKSSGGGGLWDDISGAAGDAIGALGIGNAVKIPFQIPGGLLNTFILGPAHGLVGAYQDATTGHHDKGNDFSMDTNALRGVLYGAENTAQTIASPFRAIPGVSDRLDQGWRKVNDTFDPNFKAKTGKDYTPTPFYQNPEGALPGLINDALNVSMVGAGAGKLATLGDVGKLAAENVTADEALKAGSTVQSATKAAKAAEAADAVRARIGPEGEAELADQVAKREKVLDVTHTMAHPVRETFNRIIRPILRGASDSQTAATGAESETLTGMNEALTEARRAVARGDMPESHVADTFNEWTQRLSDAAKGRETPAEAPLAASETPEAQPPQEGAPEAYTGPERRTRPLDMPEGARYVMRDANGAEITALGDLGTDAGLAAKAMASETARHNGSFLNIEDAAGNVIHQGAPREVLPPTMPAPVENPEITEPRFTVTDPKGAPVMRTPNLAEAQSAAAAIEKEGNGAATIQHEVPPGQLPPEGVPEQPSVADSATPRPVEPRPDTAGARAADVDFAKILRESGDPQQIEMADQIEAQLDAPAENPIPPEAAAEATAPTPEPDLGPDSVPQMRKLVHLAQEPTPGWATNVVDHLPKPVVDLLSAVDRAVHRHDTNVLVRELSRTVDAARAQELHSPGMRIMREDIARPLVGQVLDTGQTITGSMADDMVGAEIMSRLTGTGLQESMPHVDWQDPIIFEAMNRVASNGNRIPPSVIENLGLEEPIAQATEAARAAAADRIEVLKASRLGSKGLEDIEQQGMSPAEKKLASKITREAKNLVELEKERVKEVQRAVRDVQRSQTQIDRIKGQGLMHLKSALDRRLSVRARYETPDVSENPVIQRGMRSLAAETMNGGGILDMHNGQIIKPDYAVQVGQTPTIDVTAEAFQADPVTYMNQAAAAEPMFQLPHVKMQTTLVGDHVHINPLITEWPTNMERATATMAPLSRATAAIVGMAYKQRSILAEGAEVPTYYGEVAADVASHYVNEALNPRSQFSLYLKSLHDAADASVRHATQLNEAGGVSHVDADTAALQQMTEAYGWAKSHGKLDENGAMTHEASEEFFGKRRIEYAKGNPNVAFERTGRNALKMVADNLGVDANAVRLRASDWMKNPSGYTPEMEQIAQATNLPMAQVAALVEQYGAEQVASTEAGARWSAGADAAEAGGSPSEAMNQWRAESDRMYDQADQMAQDGKTKAASKMAAKARELDRAATAAEGHPDMNSLAAEVKGKIVGLTMPRPDGALVRLFRGADLGTLLHENAHVLRTILKPEELNVVEDSLDVPRGTFSRNLLDPLQGVVRRAAEEKFVAETLDYIMSGKHASPALDPVLEQIRNGLGDLWDSYRHTREAEFQTDPALANVLDSYLAPRVLPSPETAIDATNSTPDFIRAAMNRTSPTEWSEEQIAARNSPLPGETVTDTLRRQKSMDRDLAVAQQHELRAALQQRRVVELQKNLQNLHDVIESQGSDAMMKKIAKSESRIEKFSGKLGALMDTPSTKYVPPAWQPMWEAITDLHKEAETDPVLAKHLMDLPKTFPEMLRIASENGFDPVHVRDFDAKTVDRLIYSNNGIGGGRDLGQEAEAGTRKARITGTPRAQSIRALAAARMEVYGEAQTNELVSYMDKYGSTPIPEKGLPKGWQPYDAVRKVFVNDKEELANSGGEQISPGEGRMIPEATAKMLKRLGQDYSHPILTALKTVTNPWRMFVLSLSPRWYVHTAIGTTVLSALSGARFSDFAAAWRSWSEENKGMYGTDAQTATGWDQVPGQTIYHDSMITGKNLTGQRGYLTDVKEALGQEDRSLGSKVTAPVKRAYESLTRVHDTINKINRSATYSAAYRTTGDAALALQEASRALVDYGDLSPFERSWVRSIIPFWSWQKGVLKIAMRLGYDHPIVFGLMDQLGNLNAEYQRDKYGEPLPFGYSGVVDVPGLGALNTSFVNPFASEARLGTKDGIAQAMNPFIGAALKSQFGASGSVYNSKDNMRMDSYGRLVPDVPVENGLTDMISSLPVLDTTLSATGSQTYDPGYGEGVGALRHFAGDPTLPDGMLRKIVQRTKETQGTLTGKSVKKKKRKKSAVDSMLSRLRTSSGL